MKRLFIISLALMSLLLVNPSDAKATEKGDFVIQPTLNLGSHGPVGGWGKGYGRGWGYGFVPGFTLNLDYNVHKYASVGGYAGFGSRNSVHHTAIGARGIFHWWQLLDDKVDADLKSEDIDFYLPFHLGVYLWSYGKTDARFNAGSGLGFRYYFAPKAGVVLEWGYQEMSYAKLGFAVRL